MKSEEILEQWAKDSKTDQFEISKKALEIAEIHCKYHKMYLGERRVLNLLREKIKKEKLTKFQYYSGKLSLEECKARGWKQFTFTVLRSDIELYYLPGDEDLIKLNVQIADQLSKVELLKDIIDHIAKMGWNLKNALDYLKFTNGDI